MIWKQVNGRLILEGALRIYWGVRGVIHLKEDDDQRTVVTARNRNSCRHSVTEVRRCQLFCSLIYAIAIWNNALIGYNFNRMTKTRIR